MALVVGNGFFRDFWIIVIVYLSVFVCDMVSPFWIDSISILFLGFWLCKAESLNKITTIDQLDAVAASLSKIGNGIILDNVYIAFMERLELNPISVFGHLYLELVLTDGLPIDLWL